jgi:hypothetical protein
MILLRRTGNPSRTRTGIILYVAFDSAGRLASRTAVQPAIPTHPNKDRHNPVRGIILYEQGQASNTEHPNKDRHNPVEPGQA